MNIEVTSDFKSFKKQLRQLIKMELAYLQGYQTNILVNDLFSVIEKFDKNFIIDTDIQLNFKNKELGELFNEDWKTKNIDWRFNVFC